MWFLVGFQPRLWGAVVFLCAAHESYKHTVTSLLLGLFCGNKQILFDCDCWLPYYRPYHKRGWITCLARKLGLKETWEQNLTECCFLAVCFFSAIALFFIIPYFCTVQLVFYYFSRSLRFEVRCDCTLTMTFPKFSCFEYFLQIGKERVDCVVIVFESS